MTHYQGRITVEASDAMYGDFYIDQLNEDFAERIFKQWEETHPDTNEEERYADSPESYYSIERDTAERIEAAYAFFPTDMPTEDIDPSRFTLIDKDTLEKVREALKRYQDELEANTPDENSRAWLSWYEDSVLVNDIQLPSLKGDK